jgi:hypothetical protein
VGGGINKVFIGPVCMLELSCTDDGLLLCLFMIRLSLSFSCMLCLDPIFGSTGFRCNRCSWISQFVAHPNFRHCNEEMWSKRI